MDNPHACLQCNRYLHRIRELEAALRNIAHVDELGAQYSCAYKLGYCIETACNCFDFTALAGSTADRGVDHETR